MLLDTRPPRIGTGTRGRPPGAYSTLDAIEDDEGNYDATYSSVSKDDLVKEAKELGVSTKGGKEEIARRIISKKSGKEEAVELFDGLEAIANTPHIPKGVSAPTPLSSAPTSSDIEDMLNAALPRRKTKDYKAETIDDMLEELRHRGVDIPEQGKDKKTDYKQILHDLMKNSD